ncbi:Uncharacterized protein FWK35_00018210 [Aphis craccivora]|uniref:Uncharacterized protein n=1 Tax=Aphis craccivora TaxID=307492 RepID=A0A6G0ZI62_APHCR|nr:Uncharacterized protein FWK35_00018210 [Aphis craccivora]
MGTTRVGTRIDYSEILLNIDDSGLRALNLRGRGRNQLTSSKYRSNLCGGLTTAIRYPITSTFKGLAEDENRKVVLFNRNLTRFPRGKLLLISVYELRHDANRARVVKFRQLHRSGVLLSCLLRRANRGHPRAGFFRVCRAVRCGVQVQAVLRPAGSSPIELTNKNRPSGCCCRVTATRVCACETAAAEEVMARTLSVMRSRLTRFICKHTRILYTSRARCITIVSCGNQRADAAGIAAIRMIDRSIGRSDGDQSPEQYVITYV